MPNRLPTCGEFRSLGAFYSRFRWYSLAVVDEPHQVVVTLTPTNWRRAGKQAFVIAILWSAFACLALARQPRPVNIARFFATGAVVCLWPLYLPLVRRLILRKRLPRLRFDRDNRVVHLLGDSRRAAISEVIAICDVIAPDESEDPVAGRYELQLVLATPAGREFVLLTGSWRPTPEKDLGRIAAEIAQSLGIPHLSVHVVEGTIVEQGAERQTAAKAW